VLGRARAREEGCAQTDDGAPERSVREPKRRAARACYGLACNLHVGRTSILHRASLNDLEQGLNPLEFTRIHRSAIVAIDRIVRLEPHSHGEFVAVHTDGARLRVSRTYRAALEARLGQSL